MQCPASSFFGRVVHQARSRREFNDPEGLKTGLRNVAERNVDIKAPTHGVGAVAADSVPLLNAPREPCIG